MTPGGAAATLGDVPTSLTVLDHLTCLEAAGHALAAHTAAAERAHGPGAPVPTTPGWYLSALLAHQVMVHEWAADTVEGRFGATEQGDPVRDEAEIAAAAGDLPGLHAALLAGVDRLVAGLRAAPDDLAVPVFLHDAPAPRAMWARRQAHETTIHAVDGLAALLGRTPTTDEALAAGAGLTAGLAVDGIDELLLGFVPRGRVRWDVDEPFTLAVRTTDLPRPTAWHLHVEPGRVVGHPGDAPDAQAVLTGTATALYLGLWNRGDEVHDAGRRPVLDEWRAVQRVLW